MAETSTLEDPLIERFLMEKQIFWSDNSSMQEAERQLLWSRRTASLTSTLGENNAFGDNSLCQDHSAQSLQIPRSLSCGDPVSFGPSLGTFNFSGIARGRDYSNQSAPAFVSMSRDVSATSAAGGVSYCNTFTPASALIDPTTYMDFPQWHLANAHSSGAYTFKSSAAHAGNDAFRSPLSSVTEVDAQVYDPSDYVARLSSDHDAHPATVSLEAENDLRQKFVVEIESSEEMDGNYACEMSRQYSAADSVFCGGFDMLRVHSNLSELASSAPQTACGTDNALSQNKQPQFLQSAYAADAGTEHTNPFSRSMEAGNLSPTDISKSRHRDTSQTANHSVRKRQGQSLQCIRPIRPKPSDESLSSRNASGPSMVRLQSTDGGQSQEKLVAIIPKTAYVRPSHPRVKCTQCDDHPDGFRGEHERRRHIDRCHRPIRKVWVTVDISEDKKFLSHCRACRNGKKYGAYYNAAAHLRRTHFNPRKRNRNGKVKENERRGGKGGGDHPPMDVLKKWMKEVEEHVGDAVSSVMRDENNGDEDNHIDDEEFADGSYNPPTPPATLAVNGSALSAFNDRVGIASNTFGSTFGAMYNHPPPNGKLNHAPFDYSLRSTNQFLDAAAVPMSAVGAEQIFDPNNIAAFDAFDHPLLNFCVNEQGSFLDASSSSFCSSSQFDAQQQYGAVLDGSLR